MDGYTDRGSNSVFFICAPFLDEGQRPGSRRGSNSKEYASSKENSSFRVQALFFKERKYMYVTNVVSFILFNEL